MLCIVLSSPAQLFALSGFTFDPPPHSIPGLPGSASLFVLRSNVLRARFKCPDRVKTQHAPEQNPASSWDQEVTRRAALGSLYLGAVETFCTQTHR